GGATATAGAARRLPERTTFFFLTSCRGGTRITTREIFVVACGSSNMHVRFGSFMANVWARSVLAHCADELKGIVPDGKRAVNRIRDNAQVLFRQREPFLPDKQATMVIAPCCLVLAAYREMRGRLALAEVEAFELVRSAVSRTFQKP